MWDERVGSTKWIDMMVGVRSRMSNGVASSCGDRHRYDGFTIWGLAAAAVAAQREEHDATGHRNNAGQPNPQVCRKSKQR
jgi:hypothetical protein